MNVFDTGVTLSKIHGAEADLKRLRKPTVIPWTL